MALLCNNWKWTVEYLLTKKNTLKTIKIKNIRDKKIILAIKSNYVLKYILKMNEQFSTFCAKLDFNVSMKWIRFQYDLIKTKQLYFIKWIKWINYVFTSWSHFVFSLFSGIYECLTKMTEFDFNSNRRVTNVNHANTNYFQKLNSNVRLASY